MSRAQYTRLRNEICSKNSCWKNRRHTDAGTTADAGQSWRLLLADDHYANCPRQTEGGHCDAVAVRPQKGSDTVRLIEIKATPEKGQNLQRKFNRTAQAVTAALGTDLTLRAELHVKPLPKITGRYRFAPKIGNRRVPVELFVDGLRV